MRKISSTRMDGNVYYVFFIFVYTLLTHTKNRNFFLNFIPPTRLHRPVFTV